MSIVFVSNVVTCAVTQEGYFLQHHGLRKTLGDEAPPHPIDIGADLLRILDADITVEDRNDSKFTAMTKYPENALCHKEVFSIVTPEGRRTLTGKRYRESFRNDLYQYECPDELMPWAYAQFGLQNRNEVI